MAVTPPWVDDLLASSATSYRAPEQRGGDAGGDDVAGYIRAAASKRGIDPEVAIKVAQSEGGLVPNRTGSFATGKSFWPYQLHYGGPGYEQFGTTAGMGNAFTAQTGYQPGDPAAWRAATDYALDAAAKNGWGAWYGARTVGVTGRQGIGSAPVDAGAPGGAPPPDAPPWVRDLFGTSGASSAPTPAARPMADAPSDAPPWVRDLLAGGAPPEAPAPTSGGRTGAAGEAPRAVFPVAGYTGKVELHHGAEAGVGGSDLFAPEGTPVVAMVPGVVQWASADDALGGNNVGVLGDDGRTYYYAHFKNAPRVKAGQRVGAGQQLGDVGRTGNAAGTPAHLHIGIGEGIQTGAGAQGGLGRNFDAVSYLRSTLTGAAPAAPDAPERGRLTSAPAAAPGDAPPWVRDLLAAGSGVGGPEAAGPAQTDEVWPVAGQQWGAVNNPFGGTQARSAGATVALPSQNVGADLTARYGAEVVAPVAGTVVEVFDAPDERDRNANHGWGGMTLLRGDNGYFYRMSHAQPGSIAAQPGQRVAQGQPLQRVGVSGNTTGAHLDYEKFDRPGHFVDPVAGRGGTVGAGAPAGDPGPAAPAWVRDLLGMGRTG